MMDREILFKGFHECMEGSENAFYNDEWHKGVWVYGAYFCLHHNDERNHIHHFIIPENTPIPKDKPIGDIQIEVAPETVSQYTEVCDELQAKIFENDIVLEKDENTHKEILYVVVFSHGSLVLKEIGKRLYRELFQPRGMTRRVISNKFSKPKLVEV